MKSATFACALLALCRGTFAGAMCDSNPTSTSASLPSSLLQTQQVGGTSTVLATGQGKSEGCGKQHVISAFKAEDTLNSLLLKPEATDLGFIHIPQNAGARIESLGLQYGRNWGFNAINHTYVEKVQMESSEVCSWFLVPPWYLPGVKVYTNKPLFCVIRDPTERVFATYLSLIKMLDRDCPISKKDYTIFTRYERCTPASLNYFVTEALSGSQYDFDCNLIPQNKYIWDWDGKQVCKETLRFEDLPTALPDLLQRYNITLPENTPLPSLLQTHAGVEDSLCPGLTVSDLDEKSIAAISAYYSDDLEMLGYS
jgi:hypothetical protein